LTSLILTQFLSRCYIKFRIVKVFVIDLIHRPSACILACHRPTACRHSPACTLAIHLSVCILPAATYLPAPLLATVQLPAATCLPAPLLSACLSAFCLLLPTCMLLACQCNGRRAELFSLNSVLWMLWIRDVYSGSRSRIFPGFIRSRIFNPKQCFLSCRKYNPGCSSRIRIFFHPTSGSRGGDPGVEKHWIHVPQLLNFSDCQSSLKIWPKGPHQSQ
jgi:hypothetical protein